MNFYSIATNILAVYFCYLVFMNYSLLSRRFHRIYNNMSGNIHSIAYVTTPSEKIAKDLARSIISQKLAACVNIVPKVTSIYEWEGKINTDEEVLMIIKTKTNVIPELTKFVKMKHPYKVCEVITVQITGGNEDYLNWISQSVSEYNSLLQCPANGK